MKQTITNRHSFSANLRGTTRALLCLMALFLIGGGVRAWGQETITLTQENLGLTGSYTTNTTKVISDVTFQWTDLMKNNTSIQAKATTGTICNTTAFEGNIQSVQITHTNDARSTTVSYSTNGSDWTVVSTFEGSATIDLSSYNCSYFKITRGKNAAYWSSIEITYTTTGVTPTAATPTFSLTEGTYVGPQNVSISCTTEGASIRYTTDGTDPTESSTMYSDPIQISETTTLKAKAWAEGYNPSNTASAIYTITQPTATAPTLPASTIFEDEFEVTITNNESDPGSKVYYTTDGSTPTSSSSYFQGPSGPNDGSLRLTQTTTVKAMAVAEGKENSRVVEATYTKMPAGMQTGTVNYVFSEHFTNESYLESGDINEYLSYTTDQGSSSNKPTYYTNGNAARFYPNKDDGNGNSMTITPAEGVTITGITLTAVNNNTPTVKYNVNGGSDVEMSFENNVYSATGLSAETSFKFRNANTTTNTQLRITSISISYIYHPTPTLTVAPATLEGFSYVVGNGPSATQSFTVTGSNLTDDVTLTNYSENFEFSIDQTNYYTEYEISITPTDGNINQTVHVRMKADLNAGTYNGEYDNIEISSTGATSKSVTLSGTVTRPAYNITIDPIIANGTITASPMQASEGTIVTITATPAEGYILETLSAYKTGEATTMVNITDNTFTMPAYGVTVTATFDQIPTYTVTFNVNGNTGIVSPMNNILSGTVIGTLPTPEYGIPDGFTFVGWSTEEVQTANVSAPATMINESYIPTANVTLFAVFATRGGAPIWKKTDIADLITNDIIVITMKKDGKYYAMSNNKGASNAPDATEVSLSSDVLSSSPSEELKWIIEVDSENYIFYNADNPEKWLYCTNSNNGVRVGTNDNKIFVISENYLKHVNTNRYLGVYNNQDWRCYTSIHTNIKDQTLTIFRQTAGYSNYTTSITNITGSTFIATNTTWDGNFSLNGQTITIQSGATLTVNGVLGNSNAANLIIENGAYLILKDNNNGVKATVKKNISGYGKGEGNYYLLGLPLAEIIYEAQDCGLTDPNRAYDLYRFDHTKELEWINHKEELFALSNGRGYLYASSTDTELAFAGTLNTTQSGRDYVYVQLFYEIGHPFTGFNLIGNPFACKAHVESAAYVMNEDGTELEPVVSPTLMPCEGLFVQATDSDQYAKICKGEAQAGKGMLTAIVSRNTHRGNTQVDRAIVSFDETKALPKFSLNANGSKLYIPQGDKHYAVVNSATEGSLPLCFKASKNGEYTLSFNTEGLEAEYLHLIDNMTGADTDLLATDSYSFSATTSDYASRFKLVFKTELQNNEANANASFAYLSDGDIVVSNEGRATLQLIDMTGRVLSTTSINGDCRINTSDMKAGLYILNLNGNTQKIVVK